MCCQPTLAAATATQKLISIEEAAASDHKLDLVQREIQSLISVLDIPVELPSLAPSAHCPSVPCNVRCAEVGGVATLEWDPCDGDQMSYEVQCQLPGGQFEPLARRSDCRMQVSAKGSVGGPRPQFRVRSLVWHSTAGDWCEPVQVSSCHHGRVHSHACARHLLLIVI